MLQPRASRPFCRDCLQGLSAIARHDIAEGEPLLDSSDSSDGLLFMKWKLILEGLESKNLKPIQRLSKLAEASHSWEYVRLADFYSLRIRFDLEKFLHLIFGTPFAGFRDRVCREIGMVPDRDIYYLGQKSARRFDLATGEIDGKPSGIQGDQPHQLLEVLSRDFYHPLRIAGIFSELSSALAYILIPSRQPTARMPRL